MRAVSRSTFVPTGNASVTAVFNGPNARFSTASVRPVHVADASERPPPGQRTMPAPTFARGSQRSSPVAMPINLARSGIQPPSIGVAGATVLRFSRSTVTVQRSARVSPGRLVQRRQSQTSGVSASTRATITRTPGWRTSTLRNAKRV